jgi:hypothetical protein
MKSIRRIQSRLSILLSITGGVTLLLLFFSFLNREVTGEENHPPASVHSPEIPEKLTFCGEEVPLEYYDVYESLERELIVSTYFHSQTLLQIKKAQRYFPVIEPILKKNNIPDDFKYLMVAESNLSNAISPAGAAGFWQLLKKTAKDYKLEVNDEVDERYHLEKSTEAACQYLLDSYEKYQNWTLVAASYNVGRNGVNRQIERQGENEYYNLLFNEETARYVFRILATKIVLAHPENYNFIIPNKSRYKPVPFRLVTISGSIPDMGEFARQQGTNYKLLKYLNPWLRDNILHNTSGKSYVIKIPTRREL